MDDLSGVMIWRVRGAEHLIRCVAEEVGEGCFELRVLSGHELLHRESFQESAPLLTRAAALREKYAPTPRADSRKAGTARKQVSSKGRGHVRE